MTGPDTDAGTEAAAEAKRRRRLPRWAVVAVIVVALVAVAGFVAWRMVFVTGLPVEAERIQDIVWHLEYSDMTINGETTPITVYADTEGSVFASNGSHLDAQNGDDGWVFTAAGSWRITDDGLTVNGSPVDARMRWKTLVVEYQEGQLLKHVEYAEGEPFDIREFATGTWQGPANAWLWWYKFEGDIITLDEDGTCQIGTLSGTWEIDRLGTIKVAADPFAEPQAVFRVEDTNTLSLIDPETNHSLSLLSRIE